MVVAFGYSTDETTEILTQLGAAASQNDGLQVDELMLEMLVIQQAANDYVSDAAESSALPDRQSLTAKRDEEIARIKRVQDLLKPNPELETVLAANSSELLSRGSSPAKQLCKSFIAGDISAADLENQFAVWALDRLIARW